MAKVKLLAYILITLVTSYIYVTHITHKLESTVKEDHKKLILLKKHKVQMQKIKNNMQYLKKRLTYIYKINDVKELLTQITLDLNITMNSLEVKDKAVTASFSADNERAVMKLLWYFVYQIPVLIQIIKYNFIKNNNIFTLSLGFNYHDLLPKHNRKITFNYLEPFLLFDNTLTISSIVTNSNKKWVLIGESWLKNNDTYDKFIIKNIFNDSADIYDTILHKIFRLYIGEKTVICP